MVSSLKNPSKARLVLDAGTAADLMNPYPVSLRSKMHVPDALTMLTEKGFSAAPVIDDAGRPVGVLSQTDLLIHDREKVEYAIPADKDGRPKGDQAVVGDIMTPVVFSVAPETPSQRVIEEMLALGVHRLFVVDKAGILVGVISAIDILKHLQEED